MARYALIADDLTGALDAGAGFARAGLRAVLPFSGRPEEAAGADVLLVNTASRELDPEQAQQAATEAARRAREAGVPRVYKKMDSVLRGHPGPELSGVLDVYGGTALVAPAFPAQGRTTIGGIQLVHGRPVEPYGGSVVHALGEAARRSDVRDATTDADLGHIATEAAANAEHRVWCGSAGLAAHVPATLGLTPPAGAQPLPLPAASRALVIAGSAHPATVEQVKRLVDAGWLHLPFDPRRLDADLAAGRSADSPAGLAARLADALQDTGGEQRVVVSTHGDSPGEGPAERSPEPQARQVRHAPEVTERILELLAALAGSIRRGIRRAGTARTNLALIMTGGETALHVCRALGARAIHVAGEALPGIPLGVLELPHAQLPVATKSGGFGGPDALLQTAAALLATR